MSFSLYFSSCRKPVDSLGPAGVTVRADEDGFDDLDDYFSQEFENKTNINDYNRLEPGDDDDVHKIVEENEEEEQEPIISQAVRKSLGPQEYTIPVKGGSEDEQVEQVDYSPLMDDDYGAMPAEGQAVTDEEEDEEIGFSPNITLRKPMKTSSSSPARSRDEEEGTEKKPVVRKPAPSKHAAAPKAKKAPSTTNSKTDQTSRVVKSAGQFYLSDEFHADGAQRQSRRNRIAPLEFWRGETVKYSVDQDLRIPVVVGVVRRAKTPQKPRPVRPSGSRRAQTMTLKSNKRRKEIEDELEDEGFAPEVNVVAKVVDYDTHVEDERLLAISADQHTPEQVKGEKFSISTVFEEGNFLTAGILSFPPGVAKPSRNSAKHALVFYVITGTFQVTINQSSFVIGNGGQFIVPRGNHYQLKNLHDQEGKLHFCHCKDSRED